MKKKTIRSGVYATLIVCIILLAILNVLTFAIPYPKLDLAVTFIPYGVSSVAIIVFGILMVTEVLADPHPNQRILGLPIVYYSISFLAASLIATIVFYVLNAFIFVPIWIPSVIEALIVAFYGIALSYWFYVKKRNDQYHEELANTAFMDEFRARLKALVAINEVESAKRPLEDLYDTARGSDPIGNEKTFDSEAELLSQLMELDDAVKSGDEARILSAVKETRSTLIERNVLCKIGK